MALTGLTRAHVVIAGGGPAGMMAGWLLARRGIDVLVLEKHADFLRDFRGDTVHPSTLELMHELGVLDQFLARPHQQVTHIRGRIGDVTVTIADLTHLPVHCRFAVLMPQWDFLNFVVEQARRCPTFRLEMEADAVGLLRAGDQFEGVRVKSGTGEIEIRADLTIAADGRQSVLRQEAGLEVETFGAPIDVLWIRFRKSAGDAVETLGHVKHGHVFVTLDRGDYWQCAFVIEKGGYEALRARGMDAFRAALADVVPFERQRVDELTGWDDVKLLTVRVDRLKEWCRPGLLCIGDAAHAMSPIGGVGINLAIQDAVATANLLGDALRTGTPTWAELRAVEERRGFPTRATQRMQVWIQDHLIARSLGREVQVPRAAVDLLKYVPWLQRIPARAVGLGFRPEHIREA